MTVREVGESSYPAPAGFLQSVFWGRFKERFGWTAHYFAVAEADPEAPGPEAADPAAAAAASLLVLTRRLAPGISIAYVPYGPENAPPGPAAAGPRGAAAGPGSPVPAPGPLVSLPDFGRAVSSALSIRPTFVRFDLPGEAAQPGGIGWNSAPTRGLRRAPVDVQPPSTVLVDLAPPEDEILAAMKSKTRYNVRLAGKKGVTVRDGRVEPSGSRGAEGDDLDSWYALYRETAGRDRIAIHSAGYYRALFETAAATDGVDVDLLLAEYDAEVLAGIILVRYGMTATYLYGASSNRKRNLMAPYALQWEAMRRAREAGARTYDLFGIPPADDPDHPMHGLYRFKTGFGGRIVHRPGGWDIPVAQAAYELYRSAERARTWYYKRVRKR